MNKGFYKDLDTNFEQALILCDRDYTHEELLNMLTNGNIPEKQIAALKFDKIESEDDVNILISNLTGCDGKIREAVASKIYFLLHENEIVRNYFSDDFAKVFADATIDINGNICRYIVDSVALIKSNDDFAVKYLNYIINIANEALDKLDEFIYKDKKYVINKQLFKLYWCLESIKNFLNEISDDDLYCILKRTIKRDEYTVREKAAEILKSLGKFNDLRAILENDNNYYVRAVFLY